MNQTEAFDASVYDLPIPLADGIRADRLRLQITGTIELDRTSEEDLALFEALRLGRDIELPLVATCVGKPQQFTPSEDGPGVVTVGAILKAHTLRR